jgi:UDP-glucose 4-epimerase
LDLVDGHIAVIPAFKRDEKLQTYNLGTGVGTTVKEVIAYFEKARDTKLTVSIVPRREGDVQAAVADVSKIKNVLGWQAKYTVLEALGLQPKI